MARAHSNSKGLSDCETLDMVYLKAALLTEGSRDPAGAPHVVRLMIRYKLVFETFRKILTNCRKLVYHCKSSLMGPHTRLNRWSLAKYLKNENVMETDMSDGLT